MTAPIRLGWEATPIAMVLTMFKDWIVSFGPDDPAVTYPTGTTCVLTIYDTEAAHILPSTPVLYTKSAVVTTDTIKFRIESDDLTAIPANKAVRIGVTYPDTPPQDWPFARGKVVWDG